MSIRQLYELQELDGEMEAAQRRLASVEERLGDRGVLEALEGDVATLERRARDVARTQKAREMEVGAMRQKLQTLETRLYSGQVTNPRELEGMERERAALLSRLEREEERLLEIMVSFEETQRSLSEVRDELERQTQSWHREQEQLSEERDAGKKALEALLKQRQGVTSLLSEEEMAVYDRLRPTKGGRAVARVERGLCQECRMTLPTHVVHRARGGREHVFCTSCGRLLYVS